MKNYFLFLLCFLPNFSFQTPSQDSELQSITAEIYSDTTHNKNISAILDYNKLLSFKDLLSAIVIQESGNGKHLSGDNGSAIGPLQIWPCIVDDVNMILKANQYSYEDRSDLKKSIEMFIIYQGYYNKELNIEKAARIWNGGPNGHLKESTIKYWSTINSIMNNQELLSQSIINDFPAFKLDYQLVV